MKKIVGLVAAMAVSGSVMAEGLYGGIVASKTDIDVDLSAYITDGYDSVGFDYSDEIASDNSFGIKLGYQATPNIALETRYTRGEFNLAIEGIELYEGDLDTWSLFSKFGYPVVIDTDTVVRPYVMAGFVHYDLDGETDNAPTFGVGVEAEFPCNWVVSIDYTMARDVFEESDSESMYIDGTLVSIGASSSFDTDTLTLGVAYKF